MSVLRRSIQAAGLVCTCMLSAACSSTAPLHRTGEPPNGLYISGVPFYPQVAYQCGPASLAAVLNYWGTRVTPEEIAAEIYMPRLKGTLSLDMWSYAQVRRFQADMRKGSLEDLKRYVQDLVPVIVFLNFGYEWFSAGHFVVVVGLDADGQAVVTYNGREQNSRIPFDRFLKAWQKTNFWTLVIRPPKAEV